jgi:hypothetical protein
MIEENENEPDDARRLLNEEFAFETQEVVEYRETNAIEIETLRQSLESEVQSYEIRCAEIKRRCWDSREVPLKTLSGFQTQAKVSNFDILRVDQTSAPRAPIAVAIENGNESDEVVSDIALLFGPVRNEKLREILDDNRAFLREQKDLDDVEKKQQQVHSSEFPIRSRKKCISEKENIYVKLLTKRILRFVDSLTLLIIYTR